MRLASRRHWYFITVDYCPICGRDYTFRERRYGRRPKRWASRHSRQEVWDYCDAL